MSLKKYVEEFLPSLDYNKLISDPVYFIENLFDVKLYPYQKEIIYSCLENPLTLVIKGRQIGATFSSACFSLWFASVHKRKTVLILALYRKQARKTLEYVKEILYAKPLLLQELVDLPYGLTRSEIRFRNGSIIETSGVSRPTGDNVRSKVAHFLIIDEAVLLLDRQFSAISPITSYTQGHRLMISTAGAEGCLFHKKVELARLEFEKNKKWTKGRLIELPACHLTYDERNRPIITNILCPKQTKKKLLEELEDLGELRFRREYCCDWLGTENQMFPKITILRKPIEVREEYWAGLDVGELVHPTVLIILKGDRENCIVHFCKEWRKPLKRKIKAREIAKVIKRFNVKNLAMDVTGIGLGLHQDLLDLGLTIQEFSWNERLKNKIMFDLREALKEEHLKIPEHFEILLYELRGYYGIPIEGTKFFKFDSISEDDYVDALALAYQSIPETYFPVKSRMVVKDRRWLAEIDFVEQGLAYYSPNGRILLGSPLKWFERMLPVILTHEVLHNVIHKLEGWETSKRFDNIFGSFHPSAIFLPMEEIPIEILVRIWNIFRRLYY